MNTHETLASHEWVRVFDPVGRFRDDLLRVSRDGVVRIYTSEAKPAVYNEQSILDTLRHIKEVYCATTHVVAGPLIVTDNKGFNGLIELRRLGVIDTLGFRKYRGFRGHFRLVESDSTLVFNSEFPHKMTHDLNSRYARDFGRWSDAEVQHLARGAKAFFDDCRRESDLRANEACTVTESDVERLMNEARLHGIVLDALEHDELCGFGESVGVSVRPLHI